MQASTTTSGSQEDSDKKYYAHVQRMLQWLEWLEILYGGNVKTQDVRDKFSKQFANSTANMGWEPGFVYLSKLCTSVERKDKNGKILSSQDPVDDGQTITLGFDHLKARYEVDKSNDNKIQETITVSGAQLNYNSGQKHQEVVMALMERAQMAFIAANIAVMEGWPTVRFDKITDPVDLFLMHNACRILKLDTVMPNFDQSTLPKITCEPPMDFDLYAECIKALESVVTEPDAPIIVPETTSQKAHVATQETVKKASSFFTAPKAA